MYNESMPKNINNDIEIMKNIYFNAFVKNGCESNLKEKKVKFEIIKNDEKIIKNSIPFWSKKSITKKFE